MRYRMLAVDLDGTLLDSQGQLSQANVDAIQRAIDVGIRVVPCTGRAWCESRIVLRDLPKAPLIATGVFVTGATISELATGRTLEISVLEPHLALELVKHLWDLPEAVLIFRDANQVGHDYLVTGSGRVTPNTQLWFEMTGANVQAQDQVTIDDLHHTMRVGVVAIGTHMGETKQQLQVTFEPRVVIQHFEAIQEPYPDQTIHVLEVFAAGVDKWHGLTWLAQQHGIESGQIAAIGDQINDVMMLREAGCGIAMANAAAPTAAVADHLTRSCDENGVAHAIDQLLAETWA